MAQRAALIVEIANEILRVQSPFVTRVGVDGVDGAGKTRFADDLARTLETLGAKVIRASVDGFHNPREMRYRRGRLSPEGFYLNSYDYANLKRVLLDPLSPGGCGRYSTAVFDHRSNLPVAAHLVQANAGEVLIFDGIFLHRPQLREYWDLSIFLEVCFATSIARLGARDSGPTDPDAPQNRRYVEGQHLYMQECSPSEAATVVIDNNNLSEPRILRWRAVSAVEQAGLKKSLGSFS
jgi:uridine kinase